MTSIKKIRMDQYDCAKMIDLCLETYQDYDIMF